ncbi:MAG: hypothetical protein Q4G49_01515 [Paracoccus sp. (in: a-proteobacteria)]|nr:hypothetical protein [Paracoccus sp. (in: a-proteobacteria)]
MTEGRAARDAETAAADARAVERARDLAGAIAARALAAQPDGIAGYARRLRDALAAMPDSERAALLAGANLRLVSARPLTDADRAALGGLPQATETDPALIAGLELRSDSGVLRNSLAHDLDRIAQAMRHA